MKILITTLTLAITLSACSTLKHPEQPSKMSGEEAYQRVQYCKQFGYDVHYEQDNFGNVQNVLCMKGYNYFYQSAILKNK